MLFEQWRPEGRQKIITALTTTPPGWVLAHKCQCATAIMPVQSQYLGPFLRAVLPTKVEASARAMAAKRKTIALMSQPST